MKIWIRIGAERGGPQPLGCRSSANAEVRFLHPGQTNGVPLSHPRRISRGRFLQAGWAVGTRLLAARPNTQNSAPATRKLLKNERIFAKWAPTSNRFWPKNRCYRKQRTKPCLTGARTHIKDFGFLALFARGPGLNFEQRRFSMTRPSPAQPTSLQRASTTKSPGEIERFYQSGCTSSNRNWPTNRSYRRQTIKPCPTETRTASSDMRSFAILHNRKAMEDVRQPLRRRVLLLPGETATNGLHRTHPE